MSLFALRLKCFNLSQGKRDIEFAVACRQLNMVARVVGLLFERLGLRRKFRQQVVDALEVLLRSREFSQRFVFARAVLHNAGGLFKDGASVLGFIT